MKNHQLDNFWLIQLQCLKPVADFRTLGFFWTLSRWVSKNESFDSLLLCSYKCLLFSVSTCVCVGECVCVCVFLLKQVTAPHPSHCEESKRFRDVFVPTCPDRPLGKPGFAVFVCSESLGTKNPMRRLYQSWAMLVTLFTLDVLVTKLVATKTNTNHFKRIS